MKYLFIFLLIPFGLFAQELKTDTLAKNIIITDTSIVEQYKVIFSYSYNLDDLLQQYARLSEDSIRVANDKTNMILNWNAELQNIRREQKRLKAIIDKIR